MKSKFYKNITALLAVTLLLTACKEPEEKYETYIQKGDSLYEQSDLIKARLEYRNAAKILPSSPQAIFKLGLVEEAEGNYQSALSAFLTAEQQDETFQPTLLKLAEFFMLAQQYDQSKERIDAILTLDPQNAQAHALSASILLKEKSFRLARNSVDNALQYDPANTIAWSVLSGIHMAREDYAKAIETLNTAIEKKPEEKSFYILKAAAFSKQENIDEVVGVYQEMFKRFPDKVSLRYDLANILIESGREKQAQAILENTVKEFPNDNNAKLKLIRFIETQGSITQAQVEIEEFIKADPDQTIFGLWLADLYARNKEHDKAIVTLQSIITTDADDWIGLNAQTALAEIQLTIGDIAFAKNLIDIVLEKEVNNLDAMFLKANLTFLQGDYRQAIAEFREILNNNPSYLKASRMLAETLLIQNHIDLAIDTLLQALKSSATDNGTLVRIAQLYSLRGESDTALEILEKITDTNPNYALGWESTARIGLETGKADITENAIKKLKAIGSQYTTAKYLQARLDQQDGKSAIATQKLKEIIQEDSAAPIASFALSTLLEMSETRKQLQELGTFLQNTPNKTITSLTILGTINTELGDQNQAEANFRTAIQKNPRTQDPYISLAKLLMSNNQSQQAIEILNTAETNVPSDIKASMLKAAILIQAEEYDTVIKIYENVLERNSGVDEAANNMAHIIADYRYQNTAQLEQARIIAERFINSDNPYYLDTLGWTYARLGLYTQAQAILARSVSLLDQPNAQIEYHYGYVLKQIGLTEQAITHLANAVKGDEPYTGKENAQKLLTELNAQPQSSAPIE